MRHCCRLLLMAGLLISRALPAADVGACQQLPLQFGDATARWTHVPLSRLKTDTIYQTLNQADGSVLQATANGAASAYVRLLSAPMQAPSHVSWQWQTAQLVPGADNRDPDREDAPVRLIFAFDGDKASLPEAEQRRFRLAKRLSDKDLPFATLMYIWADGVPVDTIIPSAHSQQVKMIVAASGSTGLGSWQTVSRNLQADYQRAFGAPAGPLLGVAVMTDTDNTGARAEGFYRKLDWQCEGP